MVALSEPTQGIVAPMSCVRGTTTGACIAFIFATAILQFFTAAAAEAALHPGDKITVTVYNHPELSGDHTVDAAGNVSLPVAGTISALNTEPDDLAKRVQDRLASSIRYASVAVQLSQQSTSVFVAGGPVGVLPYAPGMTIASVVDYLNVQAPVPAAGSTDAQNLAQHVASQGAFDLENGPIDFHKVRILRDGAPLGTYDILALRAAGDPGPGLLPNDTIALQNKPIAVNVTGEVARPGTAYLDAQEPLSVAITQAGGLTATSTESGILLYRNGSPNNAVSIGSPEFAAPALAGDRIVVPRAPRVDVLGNVEKPGDTLLRGNNTLVGAIYYAGGPAKYANLRAVTVIHAGTRKQYDLGNVQKGKATDNPVLADGDMVQVPQGSTFEWGDIWGAIGSLGLFGVHI
jgi:protein involved in polysaccharide export with SLBB domain